MEKDSISAPVDNYVTDVSRRYTTTSLFYDTDSDDRTCGESSDSDTYQETDLNRDFLLSRPLTNHLSQKSSQRVTEGCHLEAEVSPNPVKDETDKPPKSLSLIELQNLPDYKVKMWSNPIYGSSRQ
jgi:hypothetical protein